MDLVGYVIIPATVPKHINTKFKKRKKISDSVREEPILVAQSFREKIASGINPLPTLGLARPPFLLYKRALCVAAEDTVQRCYSWFLHLNFIDDLF